MRRGVLLLILILTGLGFADAAGTSSAAFLKIAPDARLVAMGEAAAAISEDAYAAYWNPAGLSRLGLEDKPKGDLAFTHNEWLQDVRIENLAAAYRLGMVGTLGLSATYLTMGDIQGYDDEGNPTSTFTSSDLAAVLSFGREVVGGVSAGLNLKYINQKIEKESANSFTGDLGLRYDADWAPGLAAGFSASNLFGEAKFVEEADPLPMMLRGGLGYTVRIDPQNRVTTAADYYSARDVSSKGHFGVEYAFKEMLMLRVGYKAGYDLFGLTAGLGLGYNFGMLGARLDYGYGAASEFGDIHRISAGISLE